MGSRKIILVLAVLTTSLPLCAESAFLKNGFRMQVERHETEEQIVHLYLAGGGTLDLAAADIDRFVADEPKPVPPPAPVPVAPKAFTIDDIVRAAGLKHGLDPAFIHSIIAAESAGNPRAVSPKGAAGLMQLMPATARLLGATDVFDPATNVEGGTAYIRQLLARYNNDVVKALAAYNAGPAAVDTYHGLPPYRETTAYVTRVIKKFNQAKSEEAAKPAER
jgi:soluble lytic murein transglycosylase-like protein